VNDLEVIAHANTPIGTIYLGRRHVLDQEHWTYEIQISGALLMSSISPVSERQLATSALALDKRPGPFRVLVGGLGLGYTAEAALEDPRVTSVRVVEKMDFVVDWMNAGKLPLSEAFAVEERLEIAMGDVYDDLLGPATETYDLILVDVDHSPDNRLSEASAPFYTVEGQRKVAEHLTPGGCLAVWSASHYDPFMDVLAEVYPKVSREDVRWNDVEDPARPFHNVLFFGQRADD